DCGRVSPNTLLCVARFSRKIMSARGRYAVRASPMAAAAAETCSTELRTAGYLSNACWTASCHAKAGARAGRRPPDGAIVSEIIAILFTNPLPQVDLPGSLTFVAPGPTRGALPRQGG